MTKTPFHWYELVNAEESLEQGDILLNVPVFEPNPNMIDTTKEIKTEKQAGDILIKTYDLIVMTQSCDFPKFDDDERVIFCPIYSYSEVLKREESKTDLDWAKLRKGHQVSMHLLNKCDIDKHIIDYQIVNLHEVITIPLGIINKIKLAGGERIRLLPPYREHLAQAFARQFMRVGLPIDLPEKSPFKK